VRSPLLDHRVVEFAATLPVEMKQRRLVRKVLLRRLARGTLPGPILERRKMGFSIPLALWLRTDLRATMQEILAPSEIRRLGYLDPVEVERITTEHLAGRTNHESKLWALINLVSWHRQHETAGRA